MKEGIGSIEKLKQETTGQRKTGPIDLFKDKKGNIKVKPKSGNGPGEPTGLNINDFKSGISCTND